MNSKFLLEIKWNETIFTDIVHISFKRFLVLGKKLTMENYNQFLWIVQIICYDERLI